MSGSEDDRDALAAEYALGALDAAEMRRVEAMAVADPAMQRAIAAWSQRLAPLATLADPVTPPDDLWCRLEQSIEGRNVTPLRPNLWRNPAVWRATTVLALGIAAAFAGVFFFRPVPVNYVAALAPLNGPAPAFMVRTTANGALLVTPLSPPAVADGRSLELWALPQGAPRPVSLGLLPLGGRLVPPSDVNVPRTQILVSLEPAGGSPTGLPTGPVLWGGTLD
jgi:anti-sigma-K factor RskA